MTTAWLTCCRFGDDVASGREYSNSRRGLVIIAIASHNLYWCAAVNGLVLVGDKFFTETFLFEKKKVL